MYIEDQDFSAKEKCHLECTLSFCISSAQAAPELAVEKSPDTGFIAVIFDFLLSPSDISHCLVIRKSIFCTCRSVVGIENVSEIVFIMFWANGQNVTTILKWFIQLTSTA